ncbi:MAG TPA: maleylpyruvate isomerase N-terminal domain-containing protein [Ilumatobacteraceae bacterium]|jgi:uncharacterized protein (TIGR03083 family)|nr:maleylpyruvate isomerase N-terminal domain-containing protein [Ilumatobacteraceae bacterium]
MADTIGNALAAADSTKTRVTELLRSGLDGNQKVEGLSWTIRDLAAHLATAGIAFREMAEGGPSPYESLDRRSETNQERLDAETTQDLGELADLIDDEIARMLLAVGLRDSDVVSWHGGTLLPVAAFLGSVVGEFLLHGCDLAGTVGKPWPIERRDALPVIDFLVAVTPLVVNTESTRGLTATYELRFRGHDTTTFTFDDGVLAVSSGRAPRADVRMSVDPASFVQVAYKRVGLARPIVTGRAVAWGRRPWLALKFPGLFQAP